MIKKKNMGVNKRVNMHSKSGKYAQKDKDIFQVTKRNLSHLRGF